MTTKSKEVKQLSLPGLEKVPAQKSDVFGFIRSLVIFSTLYSGLAFGSVALVSTLLSKEDQSLMSAMLIAAIVPLLPALCLSLLIDSKIEQAEEKKSGRIVIFPEKK